MATGPEETELLAAIERAFAGVRLEDGASLNITEYNDSGGSVKHFLERAKQDERDDWRRIDDATLEESKVTFCFTDLKGFRFYLPAYMSYAVRRHDVSDSIISDLTIYALTPDHHLFKEVPMVQWFTREQIEVIVRFLRYCIAHDGTLDGEAARTNLEMIEDHLASP